jgi:hypothetical protein
MRGDAEHVESVGAMNEAGPSRHEFSRASMISRAFPTLVLAAALLPAARAGAESSPDARTCAHDAARIVSALEATGARVRVMLRRSRVRRDARAIGCFDEALSRVDVATRHAREEATLAREAARTGDGDDARGHWMRAARLRDAAREAVAAGDACAAGGRAPPPVEGTWVRLIVDPAIAPVQP